MANRKNSWQDRRWKLFEKAQITDPDLLSTIKTIVEAVEPEQALSYVGHILTLIELPLGLSKAVLTYSINPARKITEIKSLIDPPVTYYSAVAKEIGPFNDVPLPEKFDHRTVLFIDPYTTKQEINEFIDEWWSDIKELVDRPTITGSLTSSLELKGKIQPTKPKRTLERDSLIMKLHNEGKNSSQIATYLIEHTKYSKIDPPYIKVIISRSSSVK